MILAAVILEDVKQVDSMVVVADSYIFWIACNNNDLRTIHPITLGSTNPRS